MADDIIIREGKEEDSEAIVAMIGELAQLDGHCEWVDDIDSIRINGFGDSPWFHTFVAETKSEQGEPLLIGMSLYYYCYSMLRGRTIHMEVLYVRSEHHGKGIGTKLWKAIAQVGIAKGCNLMDIGVLESNARAKKFYKSKGVYDFTDAQGAHVLFMEKEAMQKLSNS